jgi:hypothetical protein
MNTRVAIHQNMANGKWFDFRLAEQLGNIGSEVSRVLSRQKKEIAEQTNRAKDRALELLDLTLADSRWQNRLKELARVREFLADLFYGKNEYNFTLEYFNEYFYRFALLARRDK